MRLVIQCAGSKRLDAPSLLAPDGRAVRFVAEPDAASACETCVYAHPDDPSGFSGLTWRDRVLVDNGDGGASFGLLPAGELYRPTVYAKLLQRLGPQRLYILSAGWGLVRADFRLPSYDITFSAKAKPGIRRHARHHFLDFNALAELGPGDQDEELVFLGGRSYLPLFLDLSKEYGGPRTVVCREDEGGDDGEDGTAEAALRLPSGCRALRFPTRARSNWQYGWANAWLGGQVRL